LRRSRNSFDVAPDVASNPRSSLPGDTRDDDGLATQSTVKSTPGEAAANEMMSQSTKATWQTVAGTRRPRRMSLVLGASVAIGTGIILAAVLFRSTEPSPAGDVEPPAQTPAMVAAPAEPAAASASPSDAEEDTPALEASVAPDLPAHDTAEPDASQQPVAKSPPAARLPRRRTPDKPTPSPEKTEPEDPFEGREPLR
jgi:hypothetical protein